MAHTDRTAHTPMTGPVRALSVPTGSVVTYTYTDVAHAADGTPYGIESTITGTIGRSVGMSRLGNMGFMVATADGDIPISRYAMVHIVTPA